MTTLKPGALRDLSFSGGGAYYGEGREVWGRQTSLRRRPRPHCGHARAPWSPERRRFAEEVRLQRGTGEPGGLGSIRRPSPLSPPSSHGWSRGSGRGRRHNPDSQKLPERRRAERREPRAEMWDPEIPSAARCRTENFGRRWFVLTERDSACFHFLRDVRGKGNVFEGLNLCCF